MLLIHNIQQWKQIQTSLLTPMQYIWDKGCKLASVKNPQANAILERIHAVLGNMLHTSDLDTAKTVKPSDIEVFLSGAT
jgi:hypothetical protein